MHLKGESDLGQGLAVWLRCEYEACCVQPLGQAVDGQWIDPMCRLAAG